MTIPPRLTYVMLTYVVVVTEERVASCVPHVCDTLRVVIPLLIQSRSLWVAQCCDTVPETQGEVVLPEGISE